MNRINFLPPWVETNCQPAFYDKESGTVLQQTARMYAKVNQLVRNVNEQNEAIELYIAKFIELKDYVEDYFDNLDVQEEINNKLDDMVEQGTLQEIITAYIQANTAWCFDTVAGMKSAENFIAGSYAQTLGYNAINDGGASTYKIRQVTNEDTVDEMFIIALSDVNLVAELIVDSEIKLSQLGASVSAEDCDDIIQAGLSYTNNNKNIVLVIDKAYTFDSIDFTGISNVSVKGTNETLRIKVNDGIIIPTNLNNFSNLCFELQNDETLLTVSGSYNSFTNCKFYGKNNHTGIGANISKWVNTFVNCSFREFSQCVIVSSNNINFTDCVIVGPDNPEADEDTVTITDGMTINFTNCDIEKGYHIIKVTGGLCSFSGCYIEGATSFYHIYLSDGFVNISNNYLNNVRVAKYEDAQLNFSDNTIEKSIADDYTVYPQEANIGYLVITNNKFINSNGYIINIDNIRSIGVTAPCPRYYNGSSWVAGTRSGYLCIMQERCYEYGAGNGMMNAQIMPMFKPNSGISYYRSQPICNTLGRGDTYYDTTLNKLLVKTVDGWVDYDGNVVS